MSPIDDQFLTMRLEDGEQVVRLRGGRGRAWKSDRPHAVEPPTTAAVTPDDAKLSQSTGVKLLRLGIGRFQPKGRP